MGSKNSKKYRVPEDDLNYLLNHTSFTEKEIRKWYKGYAKECPEGNLSRSKFLEVYSEFFPDGQAKAFYEHVFRTFDADDSGEIDFREFLTAISTTRSGKPEEKLELAFRLYDIDRNGFIDQEEMSEIIKAIFLMVGKPVQAKQSPKLKTAEIFRKMDSNKDGVLSKKEFINGCMSDKTLYDMLTADGGNSPNGKRN